MMMSWEEGKIYRCAIHVHTDYDDGEMPLRNVIELAEQAGVDALFLTDHHHAYAAEAGWKGRHGNLFLVVGTEFSTREDDHLLAFGLYGKVNTRRLATPDALHLLKNLGATVFVAHPQGRPWWYFFRKHCLWNYWDSSEYHGIEIWSYMHDWIENLKPWTLPRQCRDPEAFITGPQAEVLRQWDLVAVRRKIAGIGALDTHGRYLPFGLGSLFSWARDGILPYLHTFQAFGHYTLVPSPPLQDREEEIQLLAALRNGQSWVVHDALASGREIRFYALRQDRCFPVGSELPFLPKTRLIVQSPYEGAIRLLCRGNVVAETKGTFLEYLPTSPGEFRVEIELGGRPWAFTNHLYLRDSTFPLR